MDLPDDLSLPLQRGAPWWYWLGGRPALDLVNTRRERWWRDLETLVTPADLSEWMVRARLLAREPRVDHGLLEEARDLREAIDAAVRSSIASPDPCPPEVLALIDSWLPDALVADRLRPGDAALPLLEPGVPGCPARHALGLVACDAAQMIGTGQRDRIRVCASETCSARFYDRSRGARRRWCSMSGCGNVAKARRHRARRAAA